MEYLLAWRLVVHAQSIGIYYYPLAGGRILGLLARAMGNLDEGVKHFEDTMVFCRTSRRRLELAWACHDYTVTLLLRSRQGDPQKTKAMLDESLAISSELVDDDRIRRSSSRALAGLFVLRTLPTINIELVKSPSLPIFYISCHSP